VIIVDLKSWKLVSSPSCYRKVANIPIDLDWKPEESNYYAQLVGEQKVALLPSFKLENGHQLISVPVAYKTWGRLNVKRDNVIVLCHALTGSSDAEDWWQPLMGAGKVFDDRRFFIFCANILGSPYGSASPLTINPDTGSVYGPSFPATTFRDDVR
jgi:homoserine O-acetyltransferase